MSGGVDSSVAAYLLQKEGYDVVGVTFEMWTENEHECSDISPTFKDAQNICNILNIPHHIINIQDDFKKHVINYFISEYESGRTPNPCVVCNRYVKFDALVNKAKELDIEYIATGHYANIEKKGERYLLKKGKDKSKDQSYFLYNLTQEQLSKTLFPLGKYTKKKIRKIANKHKLPVASKPDSQEVCFIPENNYKNFIEKHSKKSLNPGNFVDIDGNILGIHEGISKYTLGQRKGLGISMGKAMFVVDIKKESNQIVLGVDKDLFSNELIATNLNWISLNILEKEINVRAKIRSTAEEKPAVISPIDKNSVKLTFKEPQRAITKGQAVVFYKNDFVIGGGIIS